jgi:hypothetical protein
MKQSQSGPLDVMQAAPFFELTIQAMPSPAQRSAFALDRHLMYDLVQPNGIGPTEPASLFGADPSEVR